MIEKNGHILWGIPGPGDISSPALKAGYSIAGLPLLTKMGWAPPKLVLGGN